MTVLICGANGSIGSFVAQEEAKTHKVVGTYRKYDDHAKELEKNPNITMVHKNMFEGTDMKDVVDKAREQGPITKVYWLVGESWNIGWDKLKLEDIRHAVKMCAEPLASLIIECKPELSDENNLMRWASISGISSLIYAGGPNKPATGGAKHMAEFYFRSASAFWTWRKNLFNNVILGNSKRTKNLYVGYHGEALKQIYKNDIPMGTGTESENVANVLLWLNSDTNQFMTGQNIVFDGAETIRTRDNVKDTPMKDHPTYY
jgi:NAD(P)-dependent dehydrogenase (short-subunit alcohol dehydrogenase family)